MSLFFKFIFIASLLINYAFAQTGLSGTYGCTLRSDSWGKLPNIGQEYDNNGLIFTIDFSRNLLSGIELRYKFDSSMKVTGVSQIEYKNSPIAFKSTGLSNIFKLQDGEQTLYFTVVNSGNTLLLAGSPESSYVGSSGVCQKM